MSKFRLLSILPLQNCNEKFCKNLTIGTPYNFTNNLTIELNTEKNKIKNIVIDKENEIKNLYKLDNDINVEISAVVGLNGSGKSALIELLFYTIYAISVHNNKKKILNEHSEIIEKRIEDQRKDTDKLYSKNKANSLDLFKTLKNNKLTLYKKDFEGITSSQKLIKNALRKRSEYLNEIKKIDKENEIFIKNNLAVSLIYEASDRIHSISFSNGKVESYKYNIQGKPEINNEFFFESFFYSICLNYSHHSLNSKVIGNWINSLFHKNDGYVTPLVINPMREDGNFNINRELHLSNERIMSNLTFEVANKAEVSLLQKYDLKKFLFSVKNNFPLIKCNEFTNKNENLKDRDIINYDKTEFNNLTSVKLVRTMLGNNYLNQYTIYQEYALGYLENKIDKIKNNYSQLFKDKNGNFNDSKFKAFLRKDKSHITKKLRQTIIFLEKTNGPSSIWNTGLYTFDYTELTIDQFRTWLSECNVNYKSLNPSSLMNFALPGFFNIDFEITTKAKKVIKLSELSSGEQQMIFNINTITYHLYNLQSIHSIKEEEEIEEEEIDRLVYKNISIILDEIEIYYHPEMQREFTFNLLNALENIKIKEEIGIESVHIIYLTHSPFILSDVPSSNILRLNNGKIEKIEQETFAANVHDLLANDFFLEKGFMGEFAKSEINHVIKHLNFVKINNKIKFLRNEIKKITSESKKEQLQKELDKIDIKENERLCTIHSMLYPKYDSEYCQKLIELVGEPMLASSLTELFIEAYPSEKHNFIQNQIEKLMKLKNNDSNSY